MERLKLLSLEPLADHVDLQRKKNPKQDKQKRFIKRACRIKSGAAGLFM